MPTVVEAERLALIKEKCRLAIRNNPASRCSWQDVQFLLDVLDNIPQAAITGAWPRMRQADNAALKTEIEELEASLVAKGLIGAPEEGEE